MTSAAAAPPVSLDGVNEAIQDIDMALAGIRQDVMHTSSQVDAGAEKIGEIEDRLEGLADPEDIAHKSEDNVFTANNQFTQPIKIVEGSGPDNAVPNSKLGEYKVELDKRIDDLDEQVEELDGRVDQNQQNIITLQEELEQLAPSFERGIWEFSISTTPVEGKYSLAVYKSKEEQETECNAKLLECEQECDDWDASCKSICLRNHDSCIQQIDPNGSFTFTNEWDKATVIVFNEKDQKGVEHEFNNVVPGMLIDVFNASDDGFMVALLGERVGNEPDGRIAFHHSHQSNIKAAQVDCLESRFLALKTALI